jgi:hypothetical protein
MKQDLKSSDFLTLKSSYWASQINGSVPIRLTAKCYHFITKIKNAEAMH